MRNETHSTVRIPSPCLPRDDGLSWSPSSPVIRRVMGGEKGKRSGGLVRGLRDNRATHPLRLTPNVRCLVRAPGVARKSQVEGKIVQYVYTEVMGVMTSAVCTYEP